MKKFIIMLLVILSALTVLALDERYSNWDMQYNFGSYITINGSKPFLNTELMYEEGWWRAGLQAELSFKDWAINEAGIYSKACIYGNFANLYGEVGVGAGLVSDNSRIAVKYRPEAIIMVDLGDTIVESRLGIVIEDSIEKDNLYLSVGVKKRFYKEFDTDE